MRTQISFKQYTTDKPAKYGILFKSLNDSRFPFTYKSLVYAGKPKVQDNTPYFISGTENYVKSLITRTQSDLPLEGRNISMDRLCTSISTAEWLLSKGITTVRTIMSNRIGLTDAAKITTGRETYSTRVFWEAEKGDINLSSYCVSSSTGKRNVLILSTVQPLLGVTTDDDKQKPTVYKLYDFMKRGTDIADQKMEKSTTKPKSHRWTVGSFSYVLDQTKINAATIYALNKGSNPSKVASFEFRWELAESLILSQVQRRSLNGLGMMVRQKINFVLGTPLVNESYQLNEASTSQLRRNIPPLGDSARKCKGCKVSFCGVEGGRNKIKNSLSNIKSQCQACGDPSCKDHLLQVCLKCVSKLS